MAQSILNLTLGTKIMDSNGNGFIVIAKNHYASNEVTLLAERYISNQRMFRSSGTDFANSDLLYYLNNTYLSSLETKLQKAIKITTVPYRHTTSSSAGSDKTVNTKIFVPSTKEAGIDYVASASEKEMSYLASIRKYQLENYSWTRTNYSGGFYYFASMSGGGVYGAYPDQSGIGAYPIFNLPSTVLVTDEPANSYYNFVFNQPPVINTISNINGVYGGTTNIAYKATDSDDTTLAHYISFNNGSTFTRIYPTKSGTTYTYSHVFNQLGTYTCRIKVVDSAGNSVTSNGFTVTVSGVAPTVNIISVVDKTIEFKVNCTTHNISKVEVLINNSVKKTYTSGFNSNLTYEVDKSILNAGKNSIRIIATSSGNMTGYKDLEANKTTYALPPVGTKVIIDNNTYDITDASINGSNHIYTLNKNLLTPVSTGEEIKITQDTVRVLCSLSNAESYKDFKEMKLVKTKALKGQLEGYTEEKYELEGEGRYSTIKIEAERFNTSVASEIIELQQYFDYMED